MVTVTDVWCMLQDLGYHRIDVEDFDEMLHCVGSNLTYSNVFFRNNGIC